jgi:hypothetical protein
LEKKKSTAEKGSVVQISLTRSSKNHREINQVAIFEKVDAEVKSLKS